MNNKSVARFFHIRATPPSLYSACDCVLQFNFKKAQIAGSVNTAADFLSRLELEVREKFHLEIREDVQTTTYEVTHPAQMSQTENNSSSRKKMVKLTLKHKHLKGESNLAKKAAEWVANEEPSSMKPSIKEFIMLDGDTACTPWSESRQMHEYE